MNNRTLIVYGSRFGATRRSAETVAAVLSQVLEDEVVLRRPRDVARSQRSLEAYANVVIGSSIAMGRWKGDVRRFVRRIDLSGKRLAVFVSAAGILNERVDETSEDERRQRAVELFVEPMAGELAVTPVATTAFGGWWRIFGNTVFDNWDEAMVQGWAHLLAREFATR